MTTWTIWEGSICAPVCCQRVPAGADDRQAVLQLVLADNARLGAGSAKPDLPTAPLDWPGRCLHSRLTDSRQAPRFVQRAAALGEELGCLPEQCFRLRVITLAATQFGAGFPDGRLPSGTLPHAADPLRVGEPFARLGPVAGSGAGYSRRHTQADRAWSADLFRPHRPSCVGEDTAAALGVAGSANHRLEDPWQQMRDQLRPVRERTRHDELAGRFGLPGVNGGAFWPA